MSDSETESVEAVEVEIPKKKGRPPMSDERRKQMLENLAKGRKTRAANLSNKRLDKETAQVKKEQEHKCDHCGSQFKYKASKNKHMKTCKDNPDSIKQPDEPVVMEEKENVVVEKKEKEEKEQPKPKAEKKKKKKVVYKEDSSSSESEEEIIIKRRKPKRRVVYADNHYQQPPPLQRQPAPAPAPARPQMTLAQKQAFLKKKQEDDKYAAMGRKQEEQANRIKMLSSNMLRKNRF